ncbi:MAG: hypothetical protein Q7S27_05980 [Nanoarchaeota archaeon]|nr:hypothetical protein [Nanoarchaeota archaeon]
MDRKHLAIFFIRIGLAFVFLYAGIGIITNPDSWIGFVPKIVSKFMSTYVVLYSHAILDIILGVWLIYGKRVFYASILCSLNLLSIIIFNAGSMDIIFRDISILFSSLALGILSYGQANKYKKSE